MRTALITGSEGFLGRYIVREFLANGWKVIGVDNRSRSAGDKLEADGYSLREIDLSKGFKIGDDFDVIVAGAAMVGGIEYFHAKPYDLLATNERITANTFDLAIKRWKAQRIDRIVAISSSMVHERTSRFPTREDDSLYDPPPASTYGFQKLAVEYFCKGAHEQYGLPYVILRPFNCVGPGEGGLEMAHVLPDLVREAFDRKSWMVLRGSGNQVRCFTHAKDVATAVRLVASSSAALQETISVGNAMPTKIADLAREIVREIHGSADRLLYRGSEPLKYDVQRRIPDVSKAERILGFKANTPLSVAIKEVIAEERKRRGTGKSRGPR